MEPTLPVGWTLNFEMLFYSVFAISIFLGLPRIRFCICAFVLLFVAAGFLSNSASLTFYAQSIILEFILGMCIAYVFLNIQYRSLGFGLALIAGGLAWMLGPIWDESTDRLIRWGLSAAMVVTGMILVEPWTCKVAGVRKLSFLGDASYSIYLSHAFAVPAAVLLLKKIGLNNSIILFGVVIAITLAVGCVSYIAIERPMISFFKKMLFDRNGAAYAKPETTHAK
jgi:exopolysaccharide production protein ExoZ